MMRLFSFCFFLSLVITSFCFGREVDDDKDIKRKNAWALTYLFSQHETFCRSKKFKAIPTEKNINLFLWYAVEEAEEGYDFLIEETLGLISDLIEDYKKLYTLVRSKKIDQKKLSRMLSHLLTSNGVNPNGYALRDKLRTPYALAREKYLLAKKHGLKKRAAFYKKICQLFKKHGVTEEYSPLEVARSNQNYVATEILLEHGAYYGPCGCYQCQAYGNADNNVDDSAYGDLPPLERAPRAMMVPGIMLMSLRLVR